MSTDYLESLSDRELHKQLIQNGFPSTPITETTRAIIIRKLKDHLKHQKLKKRKSSSFVFHTSELEANSSDQAYKDVLSPNEEYGFQNYSDSTDFSSCKRSNVYCNNNLNNPKTVHAPTSRMFATPPISSYGCCNNDSLKHRSPCPIPCSIESPISQNKSNGITNISDGGVVNRLLSFRDTTIQRKINNRIYTGDASQAFARSKKKIMFIPTNLKSVIQSIRLNQYIIPHVLMATFLIFLVIISVIYVIKKFDQNTFDETVIQYTVCGQHDDTSKSMCISNEMLKTAVSINKELLGILNDRAKQHHCEHANISPTLEMNDFIKALNDGDSKAPIRNLRSKLLAAKYLITQNPQWMIKILDSTEPLNSAVQNVNLLDNLSFELTKPNLPLKCIIIKKITRFFAIVGALILIITGGLAAKYLFSVYRAMRKERVDATVKLAKDLINELILMSSQSANSEVLLNDLQDKLLPLPIRSKLLKTWNAAIKILEETDSRVLFGMVVRNGNQLRTITWNGKPDNKNLSTTKKWQSPAFDNLNKIANPPTPCLKIRHMFDSTEVNHPNLRQLIIEAIYEKVGSRSKICDIQLDTQNCCVYLRCGSEVDAGIVHNEMNGWWFDKRLISIKFLRLERYLSRFPQPSIDPINFIDPNVINTHNRS